MGRQAGTSTPRSRGAYGSTRGKERQLRKRNNRAQTYRNQRAAEEAERHQKDLDDLMAHQAANPVMGAAEGARIAAEIEARHNQIMADIERKTDQLDTEDEVLEETTVDLVKTTKFSRKELQKESKGKFQFAETTARMMMKQGYNIKYVIAFTGVGYNDLKQFPLDDEGYAIVPTDEDNDEQG